MLSHAQIGPFADALKLALRGCKGCTRAALGRQLVGLANDTRTRFFAAIEVELGAVGERLVDAVDGVMRRYGQPCFYEERRLHFSIAWSTRPIVGEGALAEGEALELPLTTAAIRGDHVLCRIGQRTHEFRLACGTAASSSSRDKGTKDE